MIATKVRLYLRLLGLAWRAVRADCAQLDGIWSMAEATHRDLGHDYNEDLILPQHVRSARS